MKPLARIVHFSDLHCAPRRGHVDANYRSVVRRALAPLIQRLPGPLNIPAEITKRIAGHDPTAWHELRRSIPAELAHEAWTKECLVVTGDLSTWGDDVSIDQSRKLIAAIASDAHISKVAMLYGNHDVWPGQPATLSGFPLFCSAAALDLRRSRLHASQFSDPRTNLPLAWPNVVPLTRLPNGGQVVLVGINTVEHGSVANAVARGYVSVDRYWEQQPGQDQLQAVAGLAGHITVGIALTHHPVYDTRAWSVLRPISPHALGNAGALAQATHAGGQVAHVVLSGHTHETLPDFGDSTGSAPNPTHTPLGTNQIQLTAGTASQMQFGAVGERKPHTWQMIQLYADATRLRVERIVFARWNGVGPFEAVATDDDDPSAVADVFELDL